MAFLAYLILLVAVSISFGLLAFRFNEIQIGRVTYIIGLGILLTIALLNPPAPVLWAEFAAFAALSGARANAIGISYNLRLSLTALPFLLPLAAIPFAIFGRQRPPAIILAAAEGNLESVIEELERGASIETTDWRGATALMLAARNGRHEVVVAMLKRGADPTAKLASGLNAAAIAEKHGHRGVAQVLRQAALTPFKVLP